MSVIDTVFCLSGREGWDQAKGASVMSNASWIQNYWGKARPSDNVSSVSPRWHPLAWHMLDVAATMEAILEARPVAARRLAALLQLSIADAIRLMVWLAAIHDIGKFARAFQCKVPEFFHEAELTSSIPRFDNTHHDGDGLLFFVAKGQNQDWVRRIWMDIDGFELLALINASVSHHGEPARHNQNQSLSNTFGSALEDVYTCLHALTELLLPEPISSQSLGTIVSATNLIAGLVTAADWLGSSQRWFPYEVPHYDYAAYWQQARVKARGAVQGAGYAAAKSIGLTDFASLTGKSDPPTPLQAWALDTPLPDGPALFILEDVTGAGKTEAAQILVHRLLADGRASGAYWAMPTMATANAMYSRQAALLRRLFQNDPKPSLALGHGQAALHDEFQTSLKEVGKDEKTLGNAHSDVTATAACHAFLGADRRLSLMADVGAGTIDQAVLSVLPSRFNTVRLAGLVEKVLVVDEAHAYDSYVETELMRLLDFQARLGGSAIILSATLTSAQRNKLMSTWQTAAIGKRKSFQEEQVASYPLATSVGLGVRSSVPIAPAQWSPRTTRVKRVASLDAVLDHLHVTLDAGGCAAWVRNTPDDVLEAAALAKSRGFKPIVFHARFAQADRQAIEQEVMGSFGPGSTPADRRGKLVIATQVIEQSLDLDFDTMASDLAPIDLLLQRAGRMRRHAKRDARGERPVGAGDTMIVLSPPPIEDAQKDWISSALQGTSFVYRNHASLWRTAREIETRGELRVPDDVRDLVEAVHGQEDCPTALHASQLDSEAEGYKKQDLAKNLLLKCEEGYTSNQIWESEAKIATRDSDPQLVIRLAKRDAFGQIIPWADVGNRPDWQAWALSEVRVGKRLVPLDATTLSAHDEDLAPIREKWGRFERDTVVCVLEEETMGIWRGAVRGHSNNVQLLYAVLSGLSRL